MSSRGWERHIQTEGGDCQLAIRNIVCHLNVLLTEKQKADINWHVDQSVSLAVMRLIRDEPLPTDAQAEIQTVLKKLVIAWDADRPVEFDEELKNARALLGFKRTPEKCHEDGDEVD